MKAGRLIELLKKYEIFVVLNLDEDEEFCRLLLKKSRSNKND